MLARGLIHSQNHDQNLRQQVKPVLMVKASSRDTMVKIYVEHLEMIQPNLKGNQSRTETWTLYVYDYGMKDSYWE